MIDGLLRPIMDNYLEAVRILHRFVDAMNELERKSPNIVKKLGAKTRSVPDSIVQELRSLADRADNCIVAWKREQKGIR